jgi:fructose-1,6-bisphosphatase/inositol monophosphatase family enzyme
MTTLRSKKHKRVLTTWSPAYDFCLLASGKVESVITDGSEIHDFAAGKLIAQEAGAKIITFSGKKDSNFTNNRFIASNNDKISKHVLGLVKLF